MIRACGSQNARGDSGRIKIRPCYMIRACGSQGMRLIKVSTIFNHYLKHAKLLSFLSFLFVSFLFDKTADTAVKRSFEHYAFHSFEKLFKFLIPFS